MPLREFYADLGARHFNSTQYLRHPSQPLYTPEPDIIHEVIGHANQLASPRFAAITEAAGQASLRLESDEAMQFVADVFWFSIEFGVIAEDGETKAYGAGILSSYGEMDEFGHMDIRPLDLHQMGTLNYDITAYQPILFRAESLDHLEDVVGGLLLDRRRRPRGPAAGRGVGRRLRRGTASGTRRYSGRGGVNPLRGRCVCGEALPQWLIASATP